MRHLVSHFEKELVDNDYNEVISTRTFKKHSSPNW
jgi:hypothetical protein